MSKVYITVEVGLIIDINDGVEVSDIINELDYNFTDTTGNATILDMAIEDYKIKDSK